jgi:hypothetical protein
MRDDETGTYWQQISGRAISGPLQGSQLNLVLSDELTFAVWKSEQPLGTVLLPVSRYAPEYEAKDWDTRMAKAPVVIDFPGSGMPPRELILGIRLATASDATRSDALMLDASSGSGWNFQGCAVSGKSKGVCLERIPMLKDYWFDWRNYNPSTSVWGKGISKAH